jgi:hypothetical protein
MKAPKPKPAIDAPPGTTWQGGPIDWLDISLGVTGEDLVPEEITAIMGREPDRAQQKGKPLYRDDGSFMRVPMSGAWWATLKPEDTDEWDCGEAMLELLATLPTDLAMWRALAARYKVSILVGLSMAAANQGFELSPEMMFYLGERRITAGFDVYFDDEKKG